MIDFIKLSSRLNAIQMADLRSKIDFFESINGSTGDHEKILANGKKVSYRSTGWTKNMKLELFPNGYIELAGSLHKYHNDGKHNFNQFGRKEAEIVLKRLIKVTGLQLPYYKVRSVEVGVNLTPPIPSDDIINNALMYKRKPFEAKHRNDEGNYNQVKLYEYLVKLYNKKLHYEKQGHDIGHEILRFELKIIKMRMLAKYRVFTLEDLMNNIEDIARDLLPKAWEEVLLHDPTVNKQTKEKTIKYANVNFWRGIAKERSYNYHHRKLYRLMEGNTCAIQAQVKDVMLDTLDCLV
ncbi:hypothetical protein N9935_02400 [Flavobacteriaceae bacterium]|nr:hypothetical protein [Flavobacteriaceae bacterium]